VRVPLNTIAMGITVVGDDCHNDRFSEASREALIMMDDATNFMGNTLNDVLSMDKIEEGAMHLKLSPFYMEDIFNVSVSTMKGSAESKRISIVLSYGDDGNPVGLRSSQLMGDRFRLEHVIVNFLSNAVKFSPIGSQIIIKMTEKVPDERTVQAIKQRNNFREKSEKIWDFGQISVDSSPSRGYREVTVVVKDNGVGISKADLSNIFTAYSQVRPEQLQQGRGTGLGLVLAKVN
jgi:signal transduction histidine kinase